MKIDSAAGLARLAIDPDRFLGRTASASFYAFGSARAGRRPPA